MKKFTICICIIFILGSVGCERRRRYYITRGRLLSSTTPPPPPPPPPSPSPSVGRDSICTLRNAYYPMVGQCDAYFECRNWTATVKFCPDGFFFKPGMPFSEFPCLYPIDVSCEGRPLLQPAQPTYDCPHKNGYFAVKNKNHCGLYKNCVDGNAYFLSCPEGLAYNAETYQCDWPDKVKGCDVESFIGFSCPGLYSDDEEGEVSVATIPVNYPHPADCRKYYACINGKPRLLSCDKNQAFDEFTGRCDDVENVICVLM